MICIEDEAFSVGLAAVEPTMGCRLKWHLPLPTPKSCNLTSSKPARMRCRAEDSELWGLQLRVQNLRSSRLGHLEPCVVGTRLLR